MQSLSNKYHVLSLQKQEMAKVEMFVFFISAVAVNFHGGEYAMFIPSITTDSSS